MVRQPPSTSHGTGDVHVPSVRLANNDIIEHMPVFGPWVHPSCLVFVSLLEQRVGDAEVMRGTHREQQLAI